MGRHKKVVMDQLSIDSSNAIKAEMSYGKYMAMKYSSGLVPTPTQRSGYKHTCLCCGKEFVTRYAKVRKYCSDQCREQYYRNLDKAGPYSKVCPICGKEFEAEHPRTKYCSSLCAGVAKHQRRDTDGEE